MGRVPGPKLGCSWANACGSVEVNIPASIRAHVPNTFWKFLRHIETLLDYLGDVDTPLGRVLVPNNRGKLSKYLGEGRSISQFLLGPHTPNTFWRFQRHIGTFVDYLGGVDTPTGRSQAPKTRPHWANTWWAGMSISQLLLGPHTPNIFCRFLRHIETFLDHVTGVETPAGRVPVPKSGLNWASFY